MRLEIWRHDKLPDVDAFVTVGDDGDTVLERSDLDIGPHDRLQGHYEYVTTCLVSSGWHKASDSSNETE